MDICAPGIGGKWSWYAIALIVGKGSKLFPLFGTLQSGSRQALQTCDHQRMLALKILMHGLNSFELIKFQAKAELPSSSDQKSVTTFFFNISQKNEFCPGTVDTFWFRRQLVSQVHQCWWSSQESWRNFNSLTLLGYPEIKVVTSKGLITRIVGWLVGY